MDEPTKPEEPVGREDNPAAQRALEKASSLPIEVVNGMATPKTLAEQLQFANWAVTSGLLPPQIDSPSKAWLVMQRGAELGFVGISAFDFLYPVNNRVRMTPDAVKAKALASGLLEDFKEESGGTEANMLARVTVKRRGIPTPIAAEFSMEDAKTAGLLGKDNWKKYPKRMLLARARGFAYGDAFKDLTGGLQVRETYDLDPGESLGSEGPVIVRAAAQPALPPSTKDPLFAELEDAPAVPVADLAPEPERSSTKTEVTGEVSGNPPIRDAKGRKVLEVDEHGPVVVSKAPFPSHAEADAALAAEEK